MYHNVQFDETKRSAWGKVQALVLPIDPKLIDDLADYEISIELSTKYRRAHLRPMKPLKD
jgi:hypothetical protein